MNSPSQPFHITGLRLVCQIKPTNYAGSFSTSNFLISQVWWTGINVVRNGREDSEEGEGGGRGEVRREELF